MLSEFRLYLENGIFRIIHIILEDIRTDKKGDEHKGVLYINGRSFRLPKEYESRLNNYKEAVECFL